MASRTYQPLTIRLRAEQVERLRLQAEAEDRSLASMVRHLVDTHIPRTGVRAESTRGRGTDTRLPHR